MAEEKTKRIRGKNFSDHEELTLLNLVDQYRNIFQNKKSDAATWKEKEEAWKKVAVQFVGLTGIHRTSRTLRDKYENLKKKSKKRKIFISGGELYTDASEEIITPNGGSITTELSNKFDDSDYTNSNTYSPVIEIKEDPLLHIDSNNVELGYTHDNIPETGLEWKSQQLRETLSKQPFFNRNKHKHSLEKEEIYLTKMRQNFLREESIRAAEKHEEELKSLRLKNELLELEILEKKKQLGID